jgi:predicted nucleic acid-binding protein
MKDNCFVDTNVLIYAYDSHFPQKQDKAKELIFELLRSKKGIVSTQVLSEFFVTVTQKVKEPLSVSQAKEEILLFSRFQVIEVDTPMVVFAIDLTSRWKFSYWDGLILAAAERAECSVLYSEDFNEGQKYGSVKVNNVFS